MNCPQPSRTTTSDYPDAAASAGRDGKRENLVAGARNRRYLQLWSSQRSLIRESCDLKHDQQAPLVTVLEPERTADANGTAFVMVGLLAACSCHIDRADPRPRRSGASRLVFLRFVCWCHCRPHGRADSRTGPFGPIGVTLASCTGSLGALQPGGTQRTWLRSCQRLRWPGPFQVSPTARSGSSSAPLPSRSGMKRQGSADALRCCPFAQWGEAR